MFASLFNELEKGLTGTPRRFITDSGAGRTVAHADAARIDLRRKRTQRENRFCTIPIDVFRTTCT
jgi:hypothetical protein